MLRLVRQTPGITVREIAERLGVDATGLYRVVNRLSDERRLRKDGPRLHPVDSATAASRPAPEAAAGGASQTPSSPAAESPETTVPSVTEAPATGDDTSAAGDT